MTLSFPVPSTIERTWRATAAIRVGHNGCTLRKTAKTGDISMGVQLGRLTVLNSLVGQVAEEELFPLRRVVPLFSWTAIGAARGHRRGRGAPEGQKTHGIHGLRATTPDVV
jgi:hypothetical protein